MALLPTDEKGIVYNNPNDAGQLAYNQRLANMPINSETLGGNATPVTLPTPKVDTTADAIIASGQKSEQDANAEKQAEANVKAQEQAAGVGGAQKERNSAMEYLKGLYDKASGIISSSDTSPEKQQLLDEQKVLTGINSEIADQNVRQRGEADAITKNGSISQEGQASLLQNVKDTYGRRLADLAIRQSASTGNVTRLQSSLDDALKMKLAPIDREISYYKDFGFKNIDALDAQEKATLANIVAEKERVQTQITTDHNILATALKTASENGVKVPDVAIAEAQKDPSRTYEIFANHGVTLVNPAEQAQKYANAAKTRAEAAGTDPNSTVTVTNADGTTSTTTAQGVISSDAKDVLEGRNTLYNIRQTMGRTNKAAAYMQKLRDDIHSQDPEFDFIASDAGGKSVSTSYVQKGTAAINSVLPNIDKIIELSNQVPRVGITGVDKLLQGGQYTFNNKKVANFHEAQKLIADEIGVALGAGTVSDMKLQLGFDVTDPSVSQEVFASNMKLVKEFLENRKKGLDSLRYKSSTAGGATSTPAVDLTQFNFKFQ